MFILRLHFASFAYGVDFTWTCILLTRREWLGATKYFIRAAGLTLAFHWGLKLRNSLGRLPDDELEHFLVEMLFKNAFQTMLSILFLTFRTAFLRKRASLRSAVM
ncbi:hypothetical protein TrLO_g4114 [Triparma laevis f. longispina]|uniref:Uncharacterized protein n=1 Tax=Triparma laevis f. longispina TaxID=1714387 RepID=A0A9W7F962_9STRA|nr:hypothetical protein TrLO_g4114 [Triparma laevis f. longispina]